MKIALLISGGVDSSVALMLLREQGHDVTAFYLKIWLEDELAHLGSCPWQEDLRYVKAVCEQARVPFEVLNLQKAYWEHVVTYTIDQIKMGHTPNPDIMCNQKIKFGAFMHQLDPSFDKIATGHYVQLATYNGFTVLKQSPDPIKDQTYFLSQLSSAQLARALFPIGHLTKKQVRELAHKYNLPNKDRKDSQGICFLGKIGFADFIRHHVGVRQGPLVEFETGKHVGEHEGFWFYTIGQRQGIKLSGGPWYVVAKAPADNTVFISRTYYAPDKHRTRVLVAQFNWFADSPAAGEYLIKLRHGPEMTAGALELNGDFGVITLEKSDQGIAPGQFAAFYRNTLCLGSAVISES